MARVITLIWCAIAGLITAGVVLALLLPAIPMRLPQYAVVGILILCVAAGVGLGAAYTRKSPPAQDR
ncbi:MAG TPA: hypothetical protein VNK41_11625 [Vicinamibacterales bacterium]|nr:hypothetical protein [Vicinamibacterales bacterium]